MENVLINEFIVEQLKKRRPDSDVVMAVCNQAGLTWDEAEMLVFRVQRQQGREITAQRKPLIYTLSAVFIAAGAGLLLWMLNESLRGLVIWVFAVPYGGNLLFMAGGLGLVLGGIAGIVQANQD